MSESNYYVKFKNSSGEVDKDYVTAKNCSKAVEKIKDRHNVKSIIASGKSVNERRRFSFLY